MPRYDAHTAFACMDALLDRATPALRAWLLTPEAERHTWEAATLYEYARVYDAAPFTGWRIADVPIDRLHGADLYVSRWGWKRICSEATAQIKALDAATKAYGRAGAEPSVDVTFAFLRAYASAIEAISLLHGCTEALDAAIRTVLTTNDAEIVKQTNAMYAKVHAKLYKSGANRTSPAGRLADAIREAESTVPLARLIRWYAALLLGSVPPYVRGQVRDLYDTLAGRRSYRVEIEPKALAATVKALDTALESVQNLWDDYLTALDPDKQGLYGLRLPFGRPPYKGDGALNNRRKVSLEGFDLTFNGEIDVSRVIVDTITERLRPVLVQYKRQSARYFPALTAEFTPHLDIWFYNAFGARTPWGHHYFSGRGVAIYPRNMPWFTAGTPDRAALDKVVQVIAHEAGHHIWNRALNEHQRDVWTKLVTQRAPIDYGAILAAFHATNARNVYAMLPTLEKTDPMLAIQIRIASSVYDPDYAKKSQSTSWRWMDPTTHKGDPQPLFWFDRDGIAALRDKQDQRKVPVFPITGYAATNPEEAWCDAFGNLMAYGPMAVLEPIRALIYAFFPKIRRNPDDGVDADT